MMSASSFKTNSETITATIRNLGLRVTAGAVAELIDTMPKSHRPSGERLLVELAHIERRERDARNLKRRTSEACLPKFTTLDEFDWNHPRSIDRATYNALLELDFLAKAQNVLLRGPSGVGKSTLAANLAWKAIQAGHRVRFATLGAALADLLRQESLPAFERRKRRYSTPELLVIDEIGYVPCDTRAADILYAIVAARHEKAATVITTNLAFKHWPAIFPGAACVGALVDRFVQHCHVIDIDADSWRQKLAQQRRRKAVKQPNAKSPSRRTA